VRALFFGDADKILSITLKDYTRCLILRMRGVPSVDATAMNALEELHKICKEKNVRLILSHVNPQPMKVMKKSGFYKSVGAENFCDHIDTALEISKMK
jgi:SulP family sulfate permease